MSEALIQPVTTFRVWSDGQDHDRLALASRGNERVLIEDGTTLWRNESFLLRKIGRRLACGAREDRPGGARMAMLDFELEIGSGAAGIYPVVARALGGEAAGTMHLSLTSAELDHYLAVVRDKVLASSAMLRGAHTSDERPARELGQRLFEALFADDVRSLYVASRQRAREQGSALRLVLRVRPPELARLPWEFLFDPGQQDYLGLSMPLVRYPEVLAPRQPLQVALPLRTARVWDATSGQQLAAVTHNGSVQAPPVEERPLWRSQSPWTTVGLGVGATALDSMLDI